MQASNQRNLGNFRQIWTLHSLAGVVLMLACQSPTQPSKASLASQVTPLVEAVEARTGRLPLEARATGVVRARNQVEIRAEIEAPIVEVLVRSGQRVQRGQPLVKLQPESLQNQLLQGQADVKVAEAAVVAAHARVAELQAQVAATRALSEKKFVSDLELAAHQAQLSVAEAAVVQTRARVDQSKAALAERQTNLNKTVVRAPISGRVGHRNAEVGMMTSPGTILFTMGDLSQLVVEVPLTETQLGQVETGTPVQISSDVAGTKPHGAKIARISPFLTAGSFSTLAEIDMANTDASKWRPGMFVVVDVFYGQSENAVLIPQSALWEDPKSGVMGVFVIAGHGSPEPEKSHAVRLQPVSVLASGRDTVGVSGLEPGSWIVTLGQHLLTTAPNARVRAKDWSHVMRLQDRQASSLLEEFLAKQQEVARTLGAAPPSNRNFVTGTTAAAPSKPNSAVR